MGYEHRSDSQQMDDRNDPRASRGITSEQALKSEWPTRGPDFNAWHADFGKLADLIQKNPDMWLRDSQLKYLRFDVDTRSGCHFIVRDRDGNRISPDRIVAAVR